MAMEVFGVSERGPGREVNGDQFLAADLTKAMEIRQASLEVELARGGLDLRGHLLAVADGVSSLATSDEASGLASEILAGYLVHTVPWFLSLRPDLTTDLKDELRKALETCDRALRAQSQRGGERMATTLTMAYIAWRRMYVAHAGDSRCYLVRDGELLQVTRDQTVAQEFVEGGVLTPEQAEESRWTKVLTSVIGGEEAELKVQVKRLELTDGDEVLLCTDGLYGPLTDADMLAILSEGGSVEDRAKRLLRSALEAGGQDDTTVLLARLSGMDAMDLVQPVA